MKIREMKRVINQSNFWFPYRDVQAERPGAGCAAEVYEKDGSWFFETYHARANPLRVSIDTQYYAHLSVPDCYKI